MPPDFTIVTPSFNMLHYLRRCHASIMDQEDATVEHIVADGVSSDGTVEWLRSRSDVTGLVRKDSGMYDAVNSGLAQARGRFVAYLNCDEQYLPGTLAYVRDYFQSHPRVDVVFGDSLIVGPDGSLLAYRKSYPARYAYIVASHLYVLSCAMFFRRKVLDDGNRFNPQLRDTGDERFVLDLLSKGYRARSVRRYVGAFTWTGQNMSTGPNAGSERRAAYLAAPTWMRAVRYPMNALRLAEKIASGAYLQKYPLDYDIYAGGTASSRTHFRVWKASWRWPKAPAGGRSV